MRAYILTDADFERLLAALDRDPQRGEQGGSQVLSQTERDAHDRAHRFYNYQIRKWADEVRK